MCKILFFKSSNGYVQVKEKTGATVAREKQMNVLRHLKQDLLIVACVFTLYK